MDMLSQSGSNKNTVSGDRLPLACSYSPAAIDIYVRCVSALSCN